MKRYHELLAWAKKVLGLAIKGQPKMAELEAMIAEAQAERVNTNDPAELRAGAASLRAVISQFDSEATAAEERAKAIEVALFHRESAIENLYEVLDGMMGIAAEYANLGLEFSWPSPLTAELVDLAIAGLTPPVPPTRIYCFWVDGNYMVRRGYVSAESFELAKARYLRTDVDFGSAHPGSCGWPAAIERCLGLLDENGQVHDAEYASTLRTVTLEGHLYEFKLDGPEYSGRSVVSALTFVEAQEKALAGDIIEGDRPDPEIAGDLRAAMGKLGALGSIIHEGHTLSVDLIL